MPNAMEVDTETLPMMDDEDELDNLIYLFVQLTVPKDPMEE